MTRNCVIFLLIFCLNYVPWTSTQTDTLQARQLSHLPVELDIQNFIQICNLGDKNNMNEILDNILIPRVVGTEGHKSVQAYIKNTLSNLQWTIETDSFEDQTPNMGKLQFENIIATLNPNAERYLILACHYDSKYFPDMVFYGATDSAVPCAMLLNLATVLNTYLAPNRDNNQLSLKLLFFDGEEAFLEWTATDSLYGARHLAKKWEAEKFLPRIDMIVLLDLLGTPDPSFFSFFKRTENWYMHLVDIEKRLAEAGQLERYTYSSAIHKSAPNTYFNERSLNTQIEDDHIPFLYRGVPIVHLISTPFPWNWHKESDNRESIDMHTVENLNKVFRIYVMEYLHLL